MPSGGFSNDGWPSSPDGSARMAACSIASIRSGARSKTAQPSGRVALPFGTGLFCDSLPDVYDLNFVRVERPAGAAEIADAVNAEMETFFHRKLTLDPGQAATGAALAAEGWEATTHLVMAQRAGARPPGGDRLRARGAVRRDRAAAHRADQRGVVGIGFARLRPQPRRAARRPGRPGALLRRVRGRSGRRLLRAPRGRRRRPDRGREHAAGCARPRARTRPRAGGRRRGRG